ncbi:ral guanine nucleotide dissociation stimulator-like [Canis lupus familiaris]|uniref:ral guanine nucleotide dissociation stimulator-like n=1 Tax=Canis lupus familiaris TaxID=9615 RepID=UPI0018F43338|nr:ral guanine nucleotide dissociation stimulator-like [Canis lupus familiaris]
MIRGMPPPSPRYGCIAAACGGDDAVLQRWKLAICCILEIWMDYYQEDFCRLPQSASLKKILEFIRQRMPGTDVELRARRYLQQLRRLHAAEPEAGATASARAKDPEALPEPAPAPTVGPAASDGPEVLEAALAAGAEGLAPAEVPAGEAKPLQIVVTALDHGCALDEPRAPAATPEEEQALATCNRGPQSARAANCLWDNWLQPLRSPLTTSGARPQLPTAGLVMPAAQRRLAFPCHFTVSIF